KNSQSPRLYLYLQTQSHAILLTTYLFAQRVFTLPEETHGPGPIFFTWQRVHAKYLVTTGFDNTLNVYGRHGEKEDHINLPGTCTGLAWDSDGQNLGVITDRSPIVILWDASVHRTTRVDTGVRDVLTIILWAKRSPLLAVGTSKGNVLIYDHSNSRKIPILGKHSKRICSGVWSEQNLLALCGEERVLSINNAEGDTVCEVGVKGEPSMMKFGVLRNEDNKHQAEENCVSLVLNKRSLMLVNVGNCTTPHVLNFKDRSGFIIDYFWHNNNSQIVIGFSMGTFAFISTNASEIGRVLSEIQVHKESLSNFAVCKSCKKLAACSDNVIKMYNTSDLQDVKSVVTVDDEKSIEWMEWSDDGQLLAVASSVGSLHVYLTRLTIIGASFGTRLAYLSSLLEVTVVSVAEDLNDSVIIIRVDIEPSLLAIGPYHVAVAMNNRVWFYALTSNQQMLLKEREYLGIIKHMVLNGDYVAVLFTDGKVNLHSIENETGAEQREHKIFGEQTETSHITCIALTNEFFIYATDSGSIEFFLLEDWTMVNIYRHSTGIRMIATDVNGLRCVVIDDRSELFLYNAVNDVALAISEVPTSPKKVLWETFSLEKGVFAVVDSKHIYVYSYHCDTIDGPMVLYIGKPLREVNEFVKMSFSLAGKDKIPTGQYPLLLYNGVIVCQTESGKTSNFVLSTHDLSEKMSEKNLLKSVLLNDLLKLRRYQDAFKICQFLDDHESWIKFAESAMYSMDIDWCIKIYRLIENTGLVESLQKIRFIEERNLLAAHLATFLKQYDLAQQLFLRSSQAKEALEMRQSIHDWDQALILAKRLAPHLIPFISREYATQLEFSGDYRSALQHFERALIEVDQQQQQESNDRRLLHHNELCEAGIARNSLRCGNTRRGIDYATKLKHNHALQLECAQILEQLKLYSDAAQMYENGHNYENAIKLYLNVKNMKKVDQLMPHIDNTAHTALIAAYAKVKEGEGKYREAVSAYLRANDHLNAVRLLLDKLNATAEAVKIVKETHSTEGAKMVARSFQQMNDMSSAIEFLVLSRCNEEAFRLASSTGQMDIYANVLLESSAEPNESKDYQSVAIYYEQDKNPLMAGKFHCLSGNYRKGVKLLLQSVNSGESEAIKMAIDAAGKSGDEHAIRYVIDFLLGEVDGVPKDFKYLFRLYMSLRQFRDAAKTAVIIAREEQNAGNYRNAHNLLFSMCNELGKQKIQIPREMYNNLCLIHSYFLAKTWIKVGDHMKSAQMLIRVCNNLSKFPVHAAAILTSAAIECQRAGLKKHAMQFATTLMKEEYRERIDPKFKRKIETFVRKSASIRRKSSEDLSNDSTQQTTSACPYCEQQLEATELNCLNCRQLIPFCVATGHHIVKDELTMCPNCKFPANITPFLRSL
ncbi:WD-repeat protein-like protein, partial [Dinothrombium tinctorium]